jgi:ferrochelatase
MTQLTRPAPIGLLLVNVGTPDAPETGPVRRYLAEFLSDPRVVDIPAVPRWLLLHGIILRFRPRKSAEAYRAVWTPQGSPLLVHSRAFRDRLAEQLGDRWAVEIGMRYGNPSIGAALTRLRAAGVDRLVVMPVFPQYASAATGTALEAVYRALSERWNVPSVSVVPPFYDEAEFLDAFAARARPHQEALTPDHVLFSFHGLPERQIRRSDEGRGHCLASPGCCDRIGPENRTCYRAQCFSTARGLAERMALAEDGFSVTFQSRLGRTPWISPHTDEVIDRLAKQGKKRLLVVCPAFVADCLETLEEIAMRAKEQFVEAGGEDLRLVPSLNDDPSWVQTAARLARRAAGV